MDVERRYYKSVNTISGMTEGVTPLRRNFLKRHCNYDLKERNK